jgi:rhodanese-related sulfurtransferase
MTPEEYPEISPADLAAKLKQEAGFHLLDVRELWELDLAQIRDPRLMVVPMSQMARERESAIPAELQDRDAEIIVMCHHGVRSMQVTQWMRALGWRKVFSLAGGIDAYANQIDPGVGKY